VELATAKVINEPTDLEAQAGNLLHLRQRDLEIWGNHLRVYNAVVERGAFLWDALSTHLMIRWGAPFERAHSAVDRLMRSRRQTRRAAAPNGCRLVCPQGPRGESSQEPRSPGRSSR